MPRYIDHAKFNDLLDHIATMAEESKRARLAEERAWLKLRHLLCATLEPPMPQAPPPPARSGEELFAEMRAALTPRPIVNDSSTLP